MDVKGSNIISATSETTNLPQEFEKHEKPVSLPGSSTTNSTFYSNGSTDKHSEMAFLDLPLELRLMIYGHVFSDLVIKIHNEGFERRQGLLDCPWPHRVFGKDPEHTVNALFEDLFFYEDCVSDYYDKYLTCTRHSVSERLRYAAYHRRKHWRHPSPPKTRFVKNLSCKAAFNMLQTCSTIYKEASPFLTSRLHLNVQSAWADVPDIPVMPFLRHYNQLAYITLTPETTNFNYAFAFNARALPNLKTLHVLESGFHHCLYAYSNTSLDTLAASAFGTNDRWHVCSWYEYILNLREEEQDFVDFDPEPAIREILREKNRARYWLRDLMLESDADQGRPENKSWKKNKIATISQRSFRIIKRWHIILDLQQIRRFRVFKASYTTKINPLIEYVPRKGRAYVAIDFDLDTKQVVRRRVTDIDGREFRTQGELSGWLSQQKDNAMNGQYFLVKTGEDEGGLSLPGAGLSL